MEFDGLHKSQRGSLGRILATASLDPSVFTWQEAPYEFAGYGPVPALVHKPTGFWFGIARNLEDIAPYSDAVEEKGRWVAFKPGLETEIDSHRRLSWTQVENYFRNWLGYVRRELNAPDFWDAVRGLGESSFSPDDSDKPFTPDEQSVVAERLSAIEHRLETIEGIGREQISLVKIEFAELRQQLPKLKKGQWLKFFLGTIANLSLRKVVSPDVLRRILEFAQELLASLGSHTLPPLS